MEQYLNESIYTIDLGDVNTAPEIIFRLSSILDNNEAHNKRISLKLGNVDLNQAQLLSIKSLINGIDSTLSTIDTKSVETEKVAISLGIIVSNVSSANTTDVIPAMPYKSAETFKEELIAESQQQNTEQNSNEYEIVEEPEVPVAENIQEQNSEINNNDEVQEQKADEPQENIEVQETQENSEPVNTEPVIMKTEIAANDTIPPVEEVQDELDVIFGANSQKSLFDVAQTIQPQYAEREELTDIIVPEQEYTKEDLELEGFPTKYIKQTIRSGQVINYEGNVVIIGDCHSGCEITAFGDITVWGVLSGIAHAGSGGNQKARVRALKMNAIQLRIANCYSRRPDSLNTVYIEKTNSFTPEEARIINGEIVVFKIND